MLWQVHDMLGVVGIFASLALLIVLAQRGWSVIFVAPLCAAFAVLCNVGDIPLLAAYTQVYMPAMGGYVGSYFPLFILGAVFGSLMNESGSAQTIALTIVRMVGSRRAILAVVLACAVLTYGGVSLFVVAFSVYPIAAELFREADLPRRLIPAAIALGSFTFTMVALPGTPAIQNAIPIPYFGTTLYAAPGLGVIASLFMFGSGMLWLRRRSKALAAEGFGDRAGVATNERARPSFLVALVPILVVVLFNFVLLRVVFPRFDWTSLDTDRLKHVPLKSIAPLWAIIGALASAIAVTIALNRARVPNLRDVIGKGTIGSLLPMANTASEAGYGAVMASLASFLVVRNALRAVASNPVVGLWLVVTVFAAMTGSASGGMSLALGAMGNDYAKAAQVMHIDPAIMHRVAAMGSAAMEILPHNGAVITLFAICGTTHKQSYFDVFVVGSLTAFVASLLVLGLYLTVGVF